MTHLLLSVVDPDTYPPNPPDSTEHILIRMTQIEEEADRIQHTIVHELAQTFITPIDREDIYAVCMAQEKAIDSMKNLGLRFFFFSFVHLRFPARKMLETLPVMTLQIAGMLECLQKTADPSEYTKVIHSEKESCEMLLGIGLSELHDDTLLSLDNVKRLIAWMQLYERIEQTVELFGDLTDTLEQVVLKYV